MADKLKIKLSIADRVYPMSINPNQEEALRKATKSIEQMIKQFEQNYAVRAMCALQFASKTVQMTIDDQGEVAEVEDKLKNLNLFLEQQLT
jgi:cell division protein ZapA